jgi:hypothetical protein
MQCGGNLGFSTTIPMDRRPPPSLFLIRLTMGIGVRSRNRADREKQTEKQKALRMETLALFGRSVE